MSYVYMNALENKAEKYDKGIKNLTLGHLSKNKRYISDNLKIHSYILYCY